MIVVDTNVWSETLRPDPDPHVLRWMRYSSAALFMPLVCVQELKFGVQCLEFGVRRQRLEADIDTMIRRMRARILEYGFDEAEAHGILRAEAMRAGRTLSAEDGQILATARVLGASVATRNVSDFEGFGVEIIDPWNLDSHA